MREQKVYFLETKINNINIVFFLSIITFDWCLFQLIVLLKPNFNCCNSFASSGIDKITIGTIHFVSVIASVPAPV